MFYVSITTIFFDIQDSERIYAVDRMDGLDNLQSFLWAKDKAGYSVVRHRHTSGGTAANLLLSGDRIQRIGGKLVEYDAYEKAPRLYLHFAKNVTDADSARAFAEEYGFPESRDPETSYEDVGSILLASEHMRAIHSRIDIAQGTLAHMDRTSKRAQGKAVPRDLIANLFNSAARPQLILNLEAKGRHLSTITKPRTLLDWMYLRLAQVVVGEIEVRICPVCRQTYESKRRKTVSATCRKKSCQRAWCPDRRR